MATDPYPQFTAAMFNIYKEAKEIGYHATIFYNMICDRKGQATAKTLINASHPSDGYEALHRLQRLDLTVEALVVENPRWHKLFTQGEVDRARDRLVEYGYEPK